MSSYETLCGKSGHCFTNWACTYSCTPELYFEPQTTEAILQVLKSALRNGRKVKVVGNGHSPSDIACTTDYMISLKHYNAILDVNEDKKQVTVQGGCLLQDLNLTLSDCGLAISVSGSISDLTVAGTVSTGSHGTGSCYNILSSYVVDMDLMLASGDVIHISKDDDDTELFLAAGLHLGALGIILTLTIQCEERFNLHLRQYRCCLKDVLENVDVYRAASDHFRFCWFPHTDYVVCYHSSRTTEPINAKQNWFWDKAIGFHLLQFLYWISTFMPAMIPFIHRLFCWLLFSSMTERVDVSYNIFNFDCLFHQYVMEWAIPLDKLSVVMCELQCWIAQNKFPAHFPVEVRFVRGDQMYLSPAYGTECCCYINITMYRPYDKLVPHSEYWAAFQAIVASVGGRPHWAKDHSLCANEFMQLYPKWEDFCRLRKQLDPTEVFMNSYLNRILHERSENNN